VPISNLVFEQCRIETGPTGIEYIENTPNSGQIRNCLICQCHYEGCDTAVLDPTAILQRNTEVRTGIISPVRVGDSFSNANDYSVLLFRQSTGQTFVRNNTNSVPFDLVANDLTVDSVGGGAARINTPRIRLADATSLTADDFSLSPGWGNATTAISSVNGYDSGATVTIASAGTDQSDNPQVTLTFRDGAFPAAPLVIAQRAGGSQAEVQFTVGNVSGTEVSFVFQGTPAAGESYVFNFLAISR
jgi:hypothetical protein